MADTVQSVTDEKALKAGIRIIAYAKHPHGGWIVYGLSRTREVGPPEMIPKCEPIFVRADNKDAPPGHLTWWRIETTAHIQHGAYPNPVVNHLAMNFGKQYPVVHGLREISESDKFLEENESKHLMAFDSYGLYFPEDNEKLNQELDALRQY